MTAEPAPLGGRRAEAGRVGWAGPGGLQLPRARGFCERAGDLPVHGVHPAPVLATPLAPPAGARRMWF